MFVQSFTRIVSFLFSSFLTFASINIYHNNSSSIFFFFSLYRDYTYLKYITIESLNISLSITECPYDEGNEH